MATIVPTSAALVGGVITFTWTNLANGDDGTPIDAPDHEPVEIQVKGTFGLNGNVKLEGSLDEGTTYATLNDAQGQALDIAIAKIERVQETTAKMRPRVTVGDGTTNLTVILRLRSVGAYA